MMREMQLHSNPAKTIAKLVLSAGAVVFGQEAANQTPLSIPPPLKAGQFTWHPERSTKGPVVVIVSLPDQMAYVYRNGIRIGQSTVSTGRPGHATPTGVFTILQKHVDHHSSIYNNAPMPYMERLTWGGIALHAGKLPGYPASHGCVRLPYDFSKLLYGVTSMQTTVVVADRKSAPKEIVRPGLVLASSRIGSSPDVVIPEPTGPFLWTPEASPDGPVSILASGADKMVYVYRNGVLIGRASMTIDKPDVPLPNRMYVVLDGKGSSPSRFVAGRPTLRWMAVSLGSSYGQYPNAKEEPLDAEKRVTLPSEFAASVYDVLAPGTTLMVTDRAATAETTTSTDFTVLTSDVVPSKAAPGK